ncbi:MAG: phage major tail tube protein [Pseudomonadota bacterium]|jgi:P2 family phage contractile tail tube protein
MSKINIHRLTNANVYLDGGSMLGRAEEVELPVLKAKMAEHKALGMVGSIEAYAGFEKLEGKIKWSSLYPEALKKTANPFASVQLQLRASVEVYSSAGRSQELPLVALLTVTFKSLPGGGYKQHENVELESEFTATYMKLTVGGEDIMEIDALANIYKAAGQDVLATYRTHIGG